MTWLSDAAIERLRKVADWPDLEDSRYRILEPIGEGGMGTVYLAEDRELDRHVALKVLKDPEFNPDAAERMLREARIVARLEHPGFVPVHDVGRLADGRIYYVMKLVRGQRLDAGCAGPAGLRERLRIFQRICEAVAFAHAHGVIHRDLKPQNVMVGAFGEVLVLDWGVAKVLRGPRHGDQATSDGPAAANQAVGQNRGHAADPNRTVTIHTTHGTVIGTPAYMAPEQARGETDRVDERSDVYALGAMLHFMLTGRAPSDDQPVEADSENPAASSSLSDGRPRFSIPKPLDAIRAKALQPDPNDRYPGVAELVEDVSRFLDGGAVSAYREGMIERIGRVAWKYRTPILLVLAYLVMRIVLLFFTGR